MAWNCRLLSEAMFYSKRYNLTRQKCFDLLSMFRHFICIFRIDKLMFVIQFDWQCVSHKHHSDIYGFENGYVMKKTESNAIDFCCYRVQSKAISDCLFWAGKAFSPFQRFPFLNFWNIHNNHDHDKIFPKEMTKSEIFSGDLFNW